MKLLAALGGNALLKRGQAQTAGNQSANVRVAADQLARVAAGNDLVVTHGNGPQIGLLALQSAAGDPGNGSSLDTLGAETDGMIGYLLEQELANRLPSDRTVATLLTRVEVDLRDPAFAKPSKPIGPMYTEEQAARLAQQRHWIVGPDGTGVRRLVASPEPKRILGLEPIRWLIERGALVIAAGGGGIPVALSADGRTHHGVEAVIDKDACSSLLARQLGVDCFIIIATDVPAVSLDWAHRSNARSAGSHRKHWHLRDGFDGPQGASRLRVRARHRPACGDRLARTYRSDACRPVRNAGWRQRLR